MAPAKTNPVTSCIQFVEKLPSFIHGNLGRSLSTPLKSCGFKWQCLRTEGMSCLSVTSQRPSLNACRPAADGVSSMSLRLERTSANVRRLAAAPNSSVTSPPNVMRRIPECVRIHACGLDSRSIRTYAYQNGDSFEKQWRYKFLPRNRANAAPKAACHRSARLGCRLKPHGELVPVECPRRLGSPSFHPSKGRW